MACGTSGVENAGFAVVIDSSPHRPHQVNTRICSPTSHGAPAQSLHDQSYRFAIGEHTGGSRNHAGSVFTSQLMLANIARGNIRPQTPISSGHTDPALDLELPMSLTTSGSSGKSLQMEAAHAHHGSPEPCTPADPDRVDSASDQAQSGEVQLSYSASEPFSHDRQAEQAAIPLEDPETINADDDILPRTPTALSAADPVKTEQGDDHNTRLSPITREQYQQHRDSRPSSPRPRSQSRQEEWTGGAYGQSLSEVIDLVSPDDSDIAPANDIRLRNKSKALPSQKRQYAQLDIDTEEEVLSRSANENSKRRKAEAPVSSSPAEAQEDDVDDDPVPLSSRRRRLSRQAIQDLEEDLRDLGSSSPVKRQRPRTSPQKAAKQKQLDLLRRRRAGEKVDESSERRSRTDKRRGRALYDTETDNSSQSSAGPALAKGTEEEDSDNRSASTLPSVDRALPWDQPDQDDDDFIVEDDALGAPAEVIPFEFTHHMHKRPKEHFRDAIEWMVQNTINPGFARDDPVYQAAFRKLEDEVRALAQSKFTSAIWKPDFVSALKARPEFHEKSVGVFEEDTCEACGKSGHIPTSQVQFRGKPYHPDTLEDVSADEDEDDGDGGREHNTDYRDNSVPPEPRKWLTGSVCKRKAHTAHVLTHWRWSLNQWVVKYLEDEGHMAPERILERAPPKWTTRRREKYANNVVDQMEVEGEIEAQYRDFKRMLECARKARV